MKHIFDTHAHYDDAAFDEDRKEILDTLKSLGVSLVVNQGIDLVSSVKSLELAKEYDYIYTAMGYHPEAAGEERKGDLDVIAELLETEEKAVAIGEIGLDYHYEDGAPRETQKDLFERQLALSKEMDLPVVVHDRDAHGDILELLRKYRPKGVVHCFSGSVEMAEEIVKLGIYIGLGGAVTFKNAKKPVAVAGAVPMDRLVLETDCPYMAPVPYRGKRNYSAYIPAVAEVIGGIRGMDAQEILDITFENGINLFEISL